MSRSSIDKQIVGYLEQLNLRQKEAVLNVMKTFVEKDDHWSDEAFISMVEERTEALESGIDKGYTWDEVRKIAQRAFDSK